MAFPLRIFQWLLVVLYFVSLDGRAAQQSTFWIKDKQGNAVYIRLEPVGCFRDAPSRALRNMYTNYRSNIRWQLYPDTMYIVKACAENAYRQGFKTLFGIQYYGECWSDGFAEERYNKYGASSNCEHGIGKDWANMVYRLSVVKTTTSAPPETIPTPEVIPPQTERPPPVLPPQPQAVN